MAPTMRRFFPILSWLPQYRRRWLRADVIAGLTIMALLVPEGMAYAELAGVEPQAAFYAAPIGLVLYAIFATSRQLVVAVSSAIAVTSASIVAEVGPADAEAFAALTAALAVMAGIVAIAAGALRLGRIARFFSPSVLTGFVSGLALLIIVKQLPKVFGLESGEGNSWHRLYAVVRDLPDSHMATLVVGLSTIGLMLLLERWFHRIPAALVALVYGIVIVSVFDLTGRGVHVVGEIPAGLALPEIPDVGWGEVASLLPGAFAIGLVMFAEAVGPARAFGAKHGYRIRDDQELIAMGAANLGAGLFQGFSIGASLSKSAAAEAAGGRSQVAGLVAAASTALVALFLTPLFENLPEAALGAIVIVAVSGMVKVGELRRLVRLRRVEFWIAVVALVGVLTFEEVLFGLLVAVLASLVALILRISRPELSVLGRLPGTMEFRSVERVPDARQPAGLMILRPDEGVFFANAESLRELARDLVDEEDRPIRAVLLDLELTGELDISGAEMLGDLSTELAGSGVELMLAGVRRPVSELLSAAGALEVIGAERVYPDVVSAVLAHTERSAAGLEPGDLDALVSRLNVLARLIIRHGAEMTGEQREALAELAEVLDQMPPEEAT
jgi:high affinity sulfate transporter 1